jgi:hypothetical protein
MPGDNAEERHRSMHGWPCCILLPRIALAIQGHLPFALF